MQMLSLHHSWWAVLRLLGQRLVTSTIGRSLGYDLLAIVTLEGALAPECDENLSFQNSSTRGTARQNKSLDASRRRVLA